jgi:large repetitive protein
MYFYQVRRICLLKLILLPLLLISIAGYGQSGNCDPSTPFFSIDLTGYPSGVWTSPAVPRVGNCCGTTPPDKCIEFSITLDPAAVAINFQITAGAVPPGALYYQIGCGPPVPVGSPICLTGPGPYTLTFCKPGNNINEYSITSIPGPSVSPDDSVGNGCSTTMYASGLLVNSSISWNSVAPGPTGAYNSYLSCTTGCDSTVVTAGPSMPPYIDYLVCGTPVAGACVSSGLFCDTIRIYFSPPITNPVTPNPAIFCSNAGGILLTGTVNGGLPPYTYAWTNGPGGTGSVVGTGLTYYATAAGTYSFIVYDQNYPACPPQITNIPVTVSPMPVVNAGPDQTVCGTSVTLNGTVTGATGGIWSGGSGAFSPGPTAGNATYTPTTSELLSGTIILTYTSTGNGACTAVSDQVVIHISPPITVTLAAPSIVCFGQTATVTANVTGGIAPFSYVWSNGQTTSTITNVLPGTYSVTVTGSGGSGCTGTAAVTIAGNPEIIVTTSPNNSISCSTTAIISASATGGTGTFSYLWSNGATTTSTIVYTGTYAITVTDAAGCTANNSVSVIASNSTLTASVNQPPVLCNGATTTITASATGGFGGYSYSWNTGATSPAIVVGAGSYCATITDGGGCTTSACVTITQNPALTISIPTPPTICNGAVTTATAFVTGGQAPYTFLWSSGQATQSITVPAGNYTATVTDAIGCNASANVTVSQASPLNIVMNQTSVSCFGGNNGSATASVAGGTPAYYYSWSPYGGSSATASGLMAGSYTVNITDAIGCAQTSTITVNQPAALTASVTVNNNASCYGSTNGSATVVPSGGTPAYFYSWNPYGGTSQSASTLGAGNFIVTITDSQGCTQFASATITQPAMLSAGIASSTNVSCNGGNNGTATATAFGGTALYTYSWSPGGGINANATNLSAATYTVTITDAQGCTAQTSVTISQPPVLSAVISGSMNVSCAGGNNGSATVSVTGGTGPYLYSWNTSPAQTGPTASGLTAGNYFVTVTDAKGCVVTSASVNITQPATLTVSATPTSFISCNSTIPISASASGGSGTYNYLWSTGAVSSTVTVNTGTYTVTVTDGNSCTASTSVSVMASNSTLTSSITAPAPICFGSTTTVSVNSTGGFGGYTYSWSNGATTSSIVAGAGNYCVTVTDAGGCISNACVTITQNTPISVTIGTPPQVCPGASATVTAVGSGGQAPYSFFWNTGQTTPSVAQPPGTYTVIISDATGSTCSSTASVTVSQETPLAITTSSTDVSCYGGNNGSAQAYVSGGMPGYTYSWSPFGGSNSSALNLTPGTYSVMVTDQIGCMITGNVIISQPVSPVTINTTTTDVLCFGQLNGTATANPAGGTSPYFYFWSGLGSTSPTITGLGTGTYTVTVADNTGCYTISTASVSEPTDITLSGSTVNSTCGASNGSASVTASGGVGAYTYSWMPSGGAASTATNLSAANYTVTVTDGNGCQDQLPLTVSPTVSTLDANFSSTTVCMNNASSFTDLSTASGDSIAGWSWDFGEPLSPSNFSSLQNPSHTYGTAGTFNVTLTVTSMLGCTNSQTVTVSVNPLPAVNYSVTPTCLNSLTVFTDNSSIASGSIISWTWDFGDPASGAANSSALQNPTHVYPAIGSYPATLTITSDNGCTGTLAQNVNITASPTADFTATNVCSGAATQFTDASFGTGATIVGWTWDFGDGSAFNNTANPLHTYPGSGNYNVILTSLSSNGCQDSDTMAIVVYPLPVASFSAAGTCLNNATAFVNTSTVGMGTISSSVWDFGNFSPLYSGTNPNYVYSAPGTFMVTLTVTSSFGCTGTVTQPVNVYSLPVANFSNNSACLNSLTQFMDLSVVPGGAASSWLWAFGDGSPVSTAQNPSYTYLSPGTYNVSLVVTSSSGCIDTVTKPVFVYPTPIPQFVVNDSNGCATYCTDFTDQSLPQSGTITAWSWDFGDGSPNGLTQNPNHCYPASGYYTISLTATNSNGCSATQTQTDLIHVYPVPTAEFSFTPQTASTLNSEVLFTDLSVGATAWGWNFGDPNDPTASYLESPSHNYLQSGNYCIMLTVQNEYLCTDTVVHCLQVDPEFTFFIPNAFTPAESHGTNDGFSGYGTNISQYDMWIFDRWGNEIFHTDDLYEKWDGRANHGKDVAQQDVYVYLVKLYDFKGNLHKYRGTVTLVR